MIINELTNIKSKNPVFRVLKYWRHSSIKTQGIFLALLIIYIGIIKSFWNANEVYINTLEERRFFIEKAGIKLNFQLQEKLLDIENIFNIIAEKILHYSESDVQQIGAKLKQSRKYFKKDALLFHNIDLIDPNGYKIADNISGLTTPKYIDSNLGWQNAAQYLHFRLHFGKPYYDAELKNNVIPLGFGIHDAKNKNFIGYLATKINTDNIKKLLTRSHDEDYNFIVIDDWFNFITSSDRNVTQDLIDQTKDIIKDIAIKQPIDPRPLFQELTIGNGIYTHYMCMERYPYIFLLGYNKIQYQNKLYYNLIHQLSRNIILTIIFITIFSALLYRIIRPISELCQIAQDISMQVQTKIPHYKAIELEALANQMRKIYESNLKILKQQEELRTKNDDLQHANEFIRSNISFMTHELKNPISSIEGMALYLKDNYRQQDSELMERNQEFMELIYKAAAYQNRQIDFFLKLFRFQEGADKKIEDSIIDLNELVRTNINMIRHHAINKNVDIEIKISSILPKIVGDPILISQIIQNLAANGAKYNKDNGKLTVEALYNPIEEQIQIKFIDTGIGIAKEDLERIFNKFERIKNERNNNIYGYGIGLNYAKHCAILHSFEIKVQSTLHIGSEFTLIIPSHRILKTSILD